MSRVMLVAPQVLPLNKFANHRINPEFCASNQNMKLSEIASVSGKGGLFKVVGSNKSGLVLESLDSTRTKLIASGSQKVSILQEISIYTNTKEGTVSLESVLKKIFVEFGNDPGVDGESDASELKSFMKAVLPEYDEQRVYVSDIKKLVKWYAVLLKESPDLFKVYQEEKAPE